MNSGKSSNCVHWFWEVETGRQYRGDEADRLAAFASYLDG
jgi:hypothetical protein